MNKKLLLIGAVSGLTLMTSAVEAQPLKREQCDYFKYPQYPLAQSCDTNNDKRDTHHGPYTS